MRLLGGIAISLALLAPVGPTAQELRPSSVLIIDNQRLFAESEFGRRIAADLAAQAADIRAENDQIVTALTDEERELTLRRPEMSAEAFRIAADAFDTKVQDIRRVRDAKEAQLQAEQGAGRARFDELVRGIVAGVMLERGASVVLDQRTVILSVRDANITDEVIARINTELGDGSSVLNTPPN